MVRSSSITELHGIMQSMGPYSVGINHHNSSSSSMVLSWKLYHELPDHSRSERVLEPGFVAVAC